MRRFGHLRQATCEELTSRSSQLRSRAYSGVSINHLLPEAFALVQEASHRKLGMRHFDVQLSAGIHLASNRIVEMQTGEGKTITAILPLYLFSLLGRGAHLATANDYLAARDAELTRPVFEALGMTVGIIQNKSRDDERQRAYRCDVTYGTAAEFGFDFLRDRIKHRQFASSACSIPTAQLDARLACRRPFFLLLDEADSIMIDDANTPLVIGAANPKSEQKSEELFRWAAQHARMARESIDFRFIAHRNKIELTDAGRRWIRELSTQQSWGDIAIVDMYTFIERAIQIEHQLQRDRNYLVDDGEVTIVDQNTGRLAMGRQWQNGIQQAVQARERLVVSAPITSSAQVTLQAFILCYPHRAGMTGTAWSARQEFRRVYGMDVIRIPTRLPCRRNKYRTRFIHDEDSKFRAIVNEVRNLQSSGRPTLIGTRSESKSEKLSQMFNLAGIAHQVLNAKFERSEARIIANAGQLGRVTISTNLAGRGTDIKLAAKARSLGGLHVILAEPNESRRVDRQLIGRCARQGDPGSYRAFVSLEDDLIVAMNFPRFFVRILDLLPACTGIWFSQIAQAMLCKENARNRMSMLYDEKKRLSVLKQIGLDPILDHVS